MKFNQEFKTRASLFIASSIGLALTTFWTPPASACGGLFCNNVAPVVQTAENIIFSHRDDAITAVVQIQYSGEAEAFSWLVPVPGIPSVGVSSDFVFSQLRGLTDPQYSLTSSVEGVCLPRPPGDVDAGIALDDAGSPAVDVIATGTAGPYVYEVISVDPNLPNVVDVATEWLATNGYEVTGEAILGDYLSSGMNLIGFKLQNGEQVASIRPVILEYASESPMVPIRLTAVATSPSMGVRVWTFGDHRHVPANYRSLVVNEARINWFSPMAGYNALVDEAADEAGGHGFVTESAGPTTLFEDLVWSDVQDQVWELIRADTTSGDGNILVSTIELLFPHRVDIRDEADTLVPSFEAPTGATVDLTAVLTCPQCERVGDVTSIEGFDRTAFLDAIHQRIVLPLRQSQAILTASPIYTRHFTSMGPDDMDEDPVFKENPGLPTVVDRVRTAHIERLCGDGDYNLWNAPWRLTLPNGATILGAGGQTNAGLSSLPANYLIAQEAETEDTQIVVDNSAVIDSTIAQRNDAFVPPPFTEPEPGSPTPESPQPSTPSPEGPSPEGPSPEGPSPDGPSPETAPNLDGGPTDAPSPRRNVIPFCRCAESRTSETSTAIAILGLGLIAFRRRRRSLRS